MPIALFGCPRGHRVNKETSTWEAYQKVGYFPPNRALERIDRQRQGPTLGGIDSTHTQTDWHFSCAGSKRSPFFQTFNTIAAILRAKVRRAIAGFIPLASRFS